MITLSASVIYRYIRYISFLSTQKEGRFRCVLGVYYSLSAERYNEHSDHANVHCTFHNSDIGFLTG